VIHISPPFGLSFPQNLPLQSGFAPFQFFLPLQEQSVIDLLGLLFYKIFFKNSQGFFPLI
jgi:hypothetical protein